MNDFTITLDSLVLDTDVIELPEALYAPMEPGPRGFRGRTGEHGKRGQDGDSIKGERGDDGKSIDPLEVARLIDTAVAHRVDTAVARLPIPKDGKSVDPLEVANLVNVKVAAAVSLIPRPKNGKDGVVDHTLLDQVVNDKLKRAFDAWPKPKDGKTVHSMGDKGDVGPNGWTPVPAVEEAGKLKAYLKIIDWIGGEGEKPPIGYVGEKGIVESARDAINIRGGRGPKGEDGTNGGGRNGSNGASAYQIAVANGFVGTEEEWLISLHGVDGTGSGGTSSIEAIADGTVNGHRAVRVSGLGKVALANSGDPATAGTVIGISLTAALNGNSVTVQVIGEIDEPTFNFTPGPVYFTAIGALTQTVPTSGYVQQIAVALDTTKISVQIGPPIVLN
jgi:hypothetical protein